MVVMPTVDILNRVTQTLTPASAIMRYAKSNRGDALQFIFINVFRVCRGSVDWGLSPRLQVIPEQEVCALIPS
jgi:hypothetical protein